MAITKKQRIELNNKSMKERAAYYAGGRVTIGTITQVMENKLVKRYVGKLRGVPVSMADAWHFATEDEARKTAEMFKEHCRKTVSGQ